MQDDPKTYIKTIILSYPSFHYIFKSYLVQFIDLFLYFDYAPIIMVNRGAFRVINDTQKLILTAFQYGFYNVDILLSSTTVDQLFGHFQYLYVVRLYRSILRNKIKKHTKTSFQFICKYTKASLLLITSLAYLINHSISDGTGSILGPGFTNKDVLTVYLGYSLIIIVEVYNQ